MTLNWIRYFDMLRADIGPTKYLIDSFGNLSHMDKRPLETESRKRKPLLTIISRAHTASMRYVRYDKMNEPGSHLENPGSFWWRPIKMGSTLETLPSLGWSNSCVYSFRNMSCFISGFPGVFASPPPAHTIIAKQPFAEKARKYWHQSTEYRVEGFHTISRWKRQPWVRFLERLEILFSKLDNGTGSWRYPKRLCDILCIAFSGANDRDTHTGGFGGAARPRKVTLIACIEEPEPLNRRSVIKASTTSQAPVVDGKAPPKRIELLRISSSILRQFKQRLPPPLASPFKYYELLENLHRPGASGMFSRASSYRNTTPLPASIGHTTDSCITPDMTLISVPNVSYPSTGLPFNSFMERPWQASPISRRYPVVVGEFQYSLKLEDAHLYTKAAKPPSPFSTQVIALETPPGEKNIIVAMAKSGVFPHGSNSTRDRDRNKMGSEGLRQRRVGFPSFVISKEDRLLAISEPRRRKYVKEETFGTKKFYNPGEMDREEFLRFKMSKMDRFSTIPKRQRDMLRSLPIYYEHIGARIVRQDLRYYCARMASHATIMFVQGDIKLPVYVVTSLNTPLWEISEMRVDDNKTDVGNVVFAKWFNRQLARSYVRYRMLKFETKYVDILLRERHHCYFPNRQLGMPYFRDALFFHEAELRTRWKTKNKLKKLTMGDTRPAVNKLAEHDHRLFRTPLLGNRKTLSPATGRGHPTHFERRVPVRTASIQPHAGLPAVQEFNHPTSQSGLVKWSSEAVSTLGSSVWLSESSEQIFHYSEFANSESVEYLNKFAVLTLIVRASFTLKTQSLAVPQFGKDPWDKLEVGSELAGKHVNTKLSENFDGWDPSSRRLIRLRALQGFYAIPQHGIKSTLPKPQAK
ncbi:uncharacterized protein BDR25DRAFT_361589 [Lindgomyces ingoldianus]|uniref:Uncharacterized protein n=1 Tax=Lindgomyces ingoldianus TaxID=673940 RepID=A0ACB6QED8_9PLEO|nr:uncharacterized protein BDR25DRAFT_361589 [Lindgomyces ingoldianus]KAF2464510.1 hypothetical protein BDR25DRAFT_361589 [Lindgomyces ingoldianus]